MHVFMSPSRMKKRPDFLSSSHPSRSLLFSAGSRLALDLPFCLNHAPLTTVLTGEVGRSERTCTRIGCLVEVRSHLAERFETSLN